MDYKYSAINDPENANKEDSDPTMDVEEALNTVGVGRYQCIAYLILCLNFMYVPANIYQDLFISYTPPHKCKTMEPPDGNTSLGNYSKNFGGYQFHIDPKYFHKACLRPDHSGNGTQVCTDDLEFDISSTGESIVSEMNLVCEKNYELVFITIHAIAAIIGSVVFTPFSDKYGRKALLLMSWSQLALMSIGMFLVGDVISYWVLRFLARLYLEGAEQALFIMACEILPTKYRSTSVAGLFLFYALGDLLLCLEAYILTDWRHLQMAVTIGVVILLPANFWLPETPHWLISVGQFKEAERFFQLAARTNNVILPKGFALKRPIEEKDDNETQGDRDTKAKAKFIKSLNEKRESQKKKDEGAVHQVHAHVGHFGQLFKALSNKMLFKDAMISSFVWSCSAYMYYGLTVSSVQPGKNIYLNFMLTGLSMLPAFPLTTYILAKMGRKKPLIIFLISLGIPIILMGSLPKYIGGVKIVLLHMVLKCLAKFCATACVSSIRLLVAELFPTTVRGMCVGFVAFFGLIGGGAGLYFSVLERITMKISTIGMGVLILIAAYLCKFLPETSNRPLPGTLVDVMESYADVLKSIVLLTSNMPGGAPPPNKVGGMKVGAVVAGAEKVRKLSMQMAAGIVEKEENTTKPNGDVDTQM